MGFRLEDQAGDGIGAVAAHGFAVGGQNEPDVLFELLEGDGQGTRYISQATGLDQGVRLAGDEQDFLIFCGRRFLGCHG